MEVIPDVVPLVRRPATHPGFEPSVEEQGPPVHLLACIRAKDPSLTTFDIDSAPDTFDQHEVTLPLSTDKFGRR
jgi:hypothetical protein